jgi:hypothetical protein
MPYNIRVDRTPLAGAGGKTMARVSKLWALAGCELAFIFKPKSYRLKNSLMK